MITVTVLDTSAAKNKSAVTKVAKKVSTLLKQEHKTVEIFLVGSKQIHKNVLAFPADSSFPRPDLTEPALGEIYLNPSYIKEHGEDLTYMLVHGFLHLLGYDHQSARDRMNMERKETALLRRLEQQATGNK